MKIYFVEIRTHNLDVFLFLEDDTPFLILTFLNPPFNQPPPPPWKLSPSVHAPFELVVV